MLVATPGRLLDHVNMRSCDLSGVQILVLDEATSNLDSESEREVQRAMEAIAAHRTTIFIAHRLSTTRACDHIIELQGGRIIASGTYADLLDASMSFRRLAGVH